MSAKGPVGNTYSNSFRAVAITFADILTTDPAMRACLERAKMAAGADVTILILGETGTGKNLLSQAIHNASKRAEGPYVSTNCSALPENLLESELFGHEKGSFTSADRLRRGCFERANGGTLFLDEIGDMSLTAQAKVLHAIEYKQFARIGGEAMLKSDVRIIAATNQPLRDQITQNGFRADLYYRLAEVTLDIPPLRARRDDIPLYVEAFIAEANDKYSTRVKKISRTAMALLKAHEWPGNVRELRAQIRSAVMLAKNKILEASDFNLQPSAADPLPPSPHTPLSALPNPAANRPGPVTPLLGSPPLPAFSSATAPRIAADSDSVVVELPPLPADSPMDLASMEKAHIARVLAATGWTKTTAARILGISRPTLDRKIEQYRLVKESE